MKKISICIPTYNEEENVNNMYLVLTKLMLEQKKYEYEILFGDNDSKDDTQHILRDIASKDKHVKVIFNNKNYGPEANSDYILRQVNSDVIIGYPCDFEAPPELIPELIKQWELGYKVVMGRKKSSNECRLMFVSRSLYYKINNLFSTVDQFEQVTGFGLFDIQVIKTILSINEPKPNIKHYVAELGFSTKLIDYHQVKRKYGKSGYSLFQYLNLAIDTFVNSTSISIRIITILGCILTILNVTVFLIVFSLYLLGYKPIVSYFVLFSFTFLLLSIIIFSIGLIGEYVFKIDVSMKKKPQVIEKERINF